MLKRGIEGLVGVALMAALVILLLPTVAQAQEEEGSSAPASVVVAPGDTLWSISDQQLGPRATPRRIAREAERIYALNQDQIGPDLNLIFAGQKFLVPPVHKMKPSAQVHTATQGANQTAQKKPAQASPAGRSAKHETAQDSRAAKAAPAKASAETNKAASPVAERDTLPKAPEATPVPVARPLSSDGVSRSPVAHFLKDSRFALSSAITAAVGGLVGTLTEVSKGTPEGRRMLGWGIIAFTLLVGALMAWKLPMRRSLRDERETWGIPLGYQGRYYTSLHTYDTGYGFSANGVSSSGGAHHIPTRRRIADAAFADLDVSREWKIGEPLRCAVSSIPLEAGPSRSRALSEAKLLAEDAMATLAFLEQRRQLSAKEHRQARAIRRFLEAVKEEQVLFPSYQGRSGPEPSSANGSKTEATAARNGASRDGRGGRTPRSRQKRLLPHNNKRRRFSAVSEVHSAEARRLLRKAVLGTRAPQIPKRSSGRVKTTRRIARIGGR
jgi:hypothetical protein